MHFTKLLLLLGTAVTSAFGSNIRYRDPDLTYYIAFPVDPQDATTIAKTEALLKSHYGETAVVPNQTDDVMNNWSITLEQSDLKATINALDGVQRVVIVPHDRVETASERTVLVARDEEVLTYLASANPSSDASKTEEFLRIWVQKDTKFRQIKNFDGNRLLGWGGLALNSSAKTEVAKYEGIVNVWRDVVKRRGVMSTKSRTHLLKKKDALFARAITWVKQENADKGLRKASQYPGSDWNSLPNFVYPTNPGMGTFIYVMDRGVQIHVINKDGSREFKTDKDRDKDRVLQTPNSIALGQKPEDDDTDNSHGTAMASKALGRQYGVAKEAKVISVKGRDNWEDTGYQLSLINRDLFDNPARLRKSVVLLTDGAAWTNTAAYPRADPMVEELFFQPVQYLSTLGVPLVSASGNEKGLIDDLPNLLKDYPECPIIVVGAVSDGDTRLDLSQYGAQLTMYAPGDQVEGQFKNNRGSAKYTGTSISAPQVAGVIATYMGYDTKPWDDNLSGVARINAITQYILGEKSSREGGRAPDRNENTRVIWNGATKENHQSAGAEKIPNENPEPKPLPPVPNQPKTKAISIILHHVKTPVQDDYMWLIFTTKVGQAVHCGNVKSAISRTDIKKKPAPDIRSPPWPGGVFKLKDLYSMDCEYKSDGSNAGALWCKGRTEPIPCVEDSAKRRQEVDCSEKIVEAKQHAVAFCEW